jgi:hypothetical protein
MDRLYAIARQAQPARGGRRRAGLRLEWKGKRIGAFGDFVSFSFQANKNITTAEGGAWC